MRSCHCTRLIEVGATPDSQPPTGRGRVRSDSFGFPEWASLIDLAPHSRSAVPGNANAPEKKSLVPPICSPAKK
jgi:hypothetical protein